MRTDSHAPIGPVAAVLGALLDRKLVLFVLLGMLSGAGALVAPFGWDFGVEVDTVPVDAIPDIGENQQIVFTEWPGRSPADVERQVTWPLTSALLGVPEVRTIRAQSMPGFSSISVIFEDDAPYRDTRTWLVEKLSSLPDGVVPAGVKPRLGPDATALGQVFGYTLEGRDPETGEAVGGWDLHELRAIQDYQVRLALGASPGVAEVASIGGFRKEIHVDVDPDALRAFDLTVGEVHEAVQASHAEVGAQTIELNRVGVQVRGVGFVRSLEDLELAHVADRDGVPILLRDVARVAEGPGERSGALDRRGVEAVGGMVTSRFGANPMEVMRDLRRALDELAPALPTRTLEDGRRSRVTVVPFYDRSELIDRTLGTLESALWQQILVTVLVVVVMMGNLSSSFLISLLLPVAVLMTFLLMRWTGVEANVVALAGIAIAIGTMVDVGIVVVENMVQRLRSAPPDVPRIVVIRDAAAEVSGAVFTAIATTILSFAPVFLLEGPEGKLFAPLAWTKTWALFASLVTAVLFLPPIAWLMLDRRAPPGALRVLMAAAVVGAGAVVAVTLHGFAGVMIVVWGVARLAEAVRPSASEATWRGRMLAGVSHVAAVLALLVLLTESWLPLGAEAGWHNLVATGLIVGGTLAFFQAFQAAYPALLAWVLRNRAVFLVIPTTIVAAGLTTWLGFSTVWAFLPDAFHRSAAGQWLHHEVPGLGHEFMPQLDEGALLFMPTTMAHASVAETVELVRQLDLLIETVPEVKEAVGKIGRVESALDPAPLSMIETLIHVHPEYEVDAQGRRRTFRVDDAGRWVRDAKGAPIEDPDGRPWRNWRPEIRSMADIWDEIARVAVVPGLTSAPMLQPISTRIVMLQTGIRAPMAIELRGPDLDALARASRDVEAALRTFAPVAADTISADRPIGSAWLEIHPDRERLALHGLTMARVQAEIETGLGGMAAFEWIEGRERYTVRVRYPREVRGTPEDIAALTLRTPGGAIVPLGDLVELRFVPGPEMIRSENGRLVAWVMFDRQPGMPEVDAARAVEALFDDALVRGDLVLPDGVSWRLAGTWENAVRARARLAIILPIVLLTIFLLLHLELRSVTTALWIFSGIAVALSGGMIVLWLHGQPWFLDFAVGGHSVREVFQIEPVNLSVAVWVGFIALFGIATDDGVVMATWLNQSLGRSPPKTVEDVRERVMEAGRRRIRPCLMTTATTLIALLPIFTSRGTGADLMIPMAIPALGGMTIEIISLFVVPALVSLTEERRVRRRG